MSVTDILGERLSSELNVKENDFRPKRHLISHVSAVPWYFYLFTIVSQTNMLN